MYTNYTHINADMYKNRQKLYMSGWICIQIIHINADMYKNRQKLYMSGCQDW